MHLFLINADGSSLGIVGPRTFNQIRSWVDTQPCDSGIHYAVYYGQRVIGVFLPKEGIGLHVYRSVGVPN